MDRRITSWHSPSLNKEMPVAVYGHYGFALLLIPTAAADYLEYERFGLVEALRPFVEAGKVKLFSVDSINLESWMNDWIEPWQKSFRHQQWNNYIHHEVIPFIKGQTSADTPVITCGASFGALHSMNLFLKRPDQINGVIAMSGVYDLSYYSKGYLDDQVYFNSPLHYLPNLTDPEILDQIHLRKCLFLLSGRGSFEDPGQATRLAQVMDTKAIRYDLGIWGEEWPHDWLTWKSQLPHYIAQL